MTAQHRELPLAAAAVASALLFIAAVLTPLVVGTSGQPTPFDTPQAIVRYYTDNAAVSQLTGLMIFWSAVALALFSALAWSQLNCLAPYGASPAIGAVGGLLAAALLMISAAGQIVLGHSGITEAPAVLRAIQFFQFLCGGPVHTTALGISIFGLAGSLWFIGRTPRWLLAVGFVIAVIAMLSSLTMVVAHVGPLIPLARFTGLVWLVTIAFVIPRKGSALS
jgi:hypothetical protein